MSTTDVRELHHLADGTPIRVMRTPLLVSKTALVGRREGDIVVGYTVPPYMPRRVLMMRRSWFMVRRDADGQLWLVRIRKPGSKR